MSLFFTVHGWILSGQTNIWDVGWETKYEIWISGRREEGEKGEEKNWENCNIIINKIYFKK